MSALSHTDAASGDELVLNSVFSDRNAVVFAPESDISRTPNVEMIPAWNESPNFPSHPSINLDHHEDRSGSLFGLQSDGEIGSYRDHVPVDERGPNIDLIMTLVCWRESCPKGGLLVPVGGVDDEPVVVNPDSVIGVSRGYGDLEIRSEEIGTGGVESIDGGVLEDEAGFCGAEDCPYDKDCDENDKEED